MNWQKMRTWTEINLENLAHNYRVLRDGLAPGCKLMAVVKANAYGHGAVRVAEKLQELGTDMLAVAALDEAMELRTCGITLPILVLGVTPPEFADEVVSNRITQTVADLKTANALSCAAAKAGVCASIHLKVDTGMSRLGVPAHDPERAAAELAALCQLPNLNAEGIFTHFARAEEDEEFTGLQLARFLAVVDRLEREHGLTFPIRHCAASAATLHFPETHLDMVRPGLALYGYAPGLLPVMTLKSRISAVKELPAGAAVSYGGTYVLERDSRIAVLPIGYADGLSRALSGKMEVLIQNRRVPQIGRICMDMCMVDVTDLPDVKPGDTAVVFGAELPLEEKADAAGTIPYELLCAISRRVPRISGTHRMVWEVPGV